MSHSDRERQDGTEQVVHGLRIIPVNPAFRRLGLGHSHLAIRHLVRQLETVTDRKPSGRPLPEWLLQFVDQISQHFEPFRGVARVGYDCQEGESGWEVAMFLGENEMIGGPEDGQVRLVNFRFNLLDLQQHFDRIEQIAWNAFPNQSPCLEQEADLSFLAIEGLIDEQRVSLQILAAPPGSFGPAIRQHSDGRLELA